MSVVSWSGVQLESAACFSVCSPPSPPASPFAGFLIFIVCAQTRQMQTIGGKPSAYVCILSYSPVSQSAYACTYVRHYYFPKVLRSETPLASLMTTRLHGNDASLEASVSVLDFSPADAKPLRWGSKTGGGVRGIRTLCGRSCPLPSGVFVGAAIEITVKRGPPNWQ